MNIWTPIRERGALIAHKGSLARVGRYSNAKRQIHVWHGRGCLVFPDGSLGPWDEWVPNTLADEGEASMINVYLKEAANPTKFMALLNDATIAETDTMATMVEAETPGTDGYARPALTAADWTAPGLDAGDMQSSSAEETFGPNTSTAWALTHVANVTVSTGTAGLFLAYIATTTSSIGTSVSFKFTERWKMQ